MSVNTGCEIQNNYPVAFNIPPSPLTPQQEKNIKKLTEADKYTKTPLDPITPSIYQVETKPEDGMGGDPNQSPRKLEAGNPNNPPAPIIPPVNLTSQDERKPENRIGPRVT